MAYLWHFLFFLKLLYSEFTDTTVRVGDLFILLSLCCCSFFLLLFLKNLIQESSWVSLWSWVSPVLYFRNMTVYWCFDMSCVEIFSHLEEIQGFTGLASLLEATMFNKYKLSNTEISLMVCVYPARDTQADYLSVWRWGGRWCCLWTVQTKYKQITLLIFSVNTNQEETEENKLTTSQRRLYH